MYTVIGEHQSRSKVRDIFFLRLSTLCYNSCPAKIKDYFLFPRSMKCVIISDWPILLPRLLVVFSESHYYFPSFLRFGLTSKLWYREVWRWQTKLSATSPAAALSLSKRKNIIDSRLVSLSFDTQGCGSRLNEFESRELFLGRFLVGSEESLRALVVNDTCRGNPFGPDLLSKIPPGVSRLTWMSTSGQSGFDAWKKAVPFFLFKSSLRFLRLDFALSALDILRDLGTGFPSLEAIQIPKASSNMVNTGEAASTLEAPASVLH